LDANFFQYLPFLEEFTRRTGAVGPIALRADRLGADPIRFNAPASSKLIKPQRTAATDF